MIYIAGKRCKIGLIVNPIAGLGGPLGERGTDDPNTVSRALKLGLKKRALDRAARALKFLEDMDISILASKGEMGEVPIAMSGLSNKFIPLEYIPPHPSTRVDTLKAAEELVRMKVDLLMFAGGDGTAKDIASVVGHELVVIGIPAGVKVFSSVFAQTPEDAGRIARDFIEGKLGERLGEVLDILEEDYKSGSFSPKVFGTLRVPESPVVQSSKSLEVPDEVSLEGIFNYIEDPLRRRTTVVLGPGRTVSYIAGRLGYRKNPSTVDVILGGRLIPDVSYFDMESIVEDLGEPPLIILTPIGGTSFLLGRGNHQLIPAVRRAEWGKDILIIATPSKIRGIKELIVDIDEPIETLPSYVRVIIGYKEEKIVKVRAAHRIT